MGAAGQRLRAGLDRGGPLVTPLVMNCSPVPSFRFLLSAYNLLPFPSLVLRSEVKDRASVHGL